MLWRTCAKRSGLLHVRGGVSYLLLCDLLGQMSSPRPWRCFYSLRPQVFSLQVFSTSVEVFPLASPRWRLYACLLHVRGGVSMAGEPLTSWSSSSPRPWRCFSCGLRLSGLLRVFSTSVEVFPKLLQASTHSARLLHVRGGVSYFSYTDPTVDASSPRPWRCFQVPHHHQRRVSVFSTSVEVFEHFGSWRDCCLLT